VAVGNEQILFIHVPKAGGSWAIDAMRAAGITLMPENSEQHHLGIHQCDRRGRFCFGFVREPLSWYGSTYNYRRRERFGDNPLLDRWLDLSFPAFLEAMIEYTPGYLTNHFGWFVGPPNETLDFVGRYERLQDGLVQALELAGVEYDRAALLSCPRYTRTSGGLPPPTPPTDVLQRLRESERGVYDRFYPDDR